MRVQWIITMASRRSVLITLGGIVAGSGALLSTGAFTTVTAERTVNVQTTGDADAFLSIQGADRPNNSSSTPSNSTENEYVSVTDGTVQINLDGSNTDEDSDIDSDGLNQNAVTTFRNLLQITNNGTQDVTSLNLTMDVASVSGSPTPEDVEAAFKFIRGSETSEIDSGSDILDSSESLSPGQNITFGFVVDLLPEGDSNQEITELPSADYTLVIEALTANSTNETA